LTLEKQLYIARYKEQNNDLSFLFYSFEILTQNIK